MMPLSAAVEPLRMANRILGQDYYSWQFSSADGGPVTAANRLQISVDNSIAQIRKAAQGLDRPRAFMVCSGADVEKHESGSLSACLRECHNQGVLLGGLSTGAHLLACAGLLDGKRCVIHWENLPGFLERFPNVDARSGLYEIGDKICTCAGGVATLDMMLTIISGDHDEDLVNQICEQIVTDKIRVSDQRQRLHRGRKYIHDGKLMSVVELMEANIAEPLQITEIAEITEVSRRQIERWFMTYTDRSPARFYLEVRLERAHYLLQQSSLPIMDIAFACGFASASNFSKCYRSVYGITPKAQRSSLTS